MDTPDSLFSEFSPTSTEAWEAAIEKSLKGRDYNSTIHRTTPDGLTIKAFQREGDSSVSEGAPGQYPFTRGTKVDGNAWYIRRDLTVADATTGNKAALNALNEGATALGLRGEVQAVSTLLAKVLPQYVALDLYAGEQAEETCSAFLDWLSEEKIDPQAIRASFGYDPIARMLLQGEEVNSFQSGIAAAKKLVGIAPLMQVFTASSAPYHEAGAGSSQELGCILAHAHEYLVAQLEGGLSVDEASARIRFEVAVGSDYFVEIAKLRALRQLWARIVEQYAPEHDCSMATWIHACTSRWTMSGMDEHTNLLRSTSQAMAAILGNCNSLSVQAYNAVTNGADANADRLAVNIQLLLQEESYLDKVADPAGGSWHIEKLTDDLAQAAWTMFQSIESKGGLIAAMKEGWIQDQIETVAASTKAQIESGEWVILGANKHPNPKGSFDGQTTDSEAPSSNTAIRPLQIFRAASSAEKASTLKSV